MKTPEFQSGEIVDVAIKGVRIFAGRTEDGTVTEGIAIVDEHGKFYNLPPQAAITRGTPVGWPPQREDRWIDGEGLVWEAMYRHDEAPFIELEPTDGRRAPLVDRNEWVRRERGPLTLDHREQQDGGESCG